jgi:hypothetical protein
MVGDCCDAWEARPWQFREFRRRPSRAFGNAGAREGGATLGGQVSDQQQPPVPQQSPPQSQSQPQHAMPPPFVGWLSIRRPYLIH